MTTDFQAGLGEVAGALLRVCKYALSRFGFGDVVFGVWHLAKHHAETMAGEHICLKIHASKLLSVVDIRKAVARYRAAAACIRPSS